MPEVTSANIGTTRPGPVRSSQSLAGGILLIALAALALWLTRDLDQGTLNTMGPAMLPRWLAIGVGLSGLALLAGFVALLIRPPLSWLMRRSGRARGGSSFGCGKAIGRAGACG
jgi:hypothetical protein